MASKYSVPRVNGVCLLDICADETRMYVALALSAHTPWVQFGVSC